MARQAISAALLLLIFSTASARDSEVDALRQQLDLLKKQVETLEQAVVRLESQSSSAPASGSNASAPALAQAPGAADSAAGDADEESRVRFNMDFRYRHDWIEADTVDERSESRDRSRIRARGDLAVAVSDNIEIGFGIASGDEDPLSTNQTLGQQASSKDWRLDLAYFEWNLFGDLDWLGGKYKNPDYRPGNYPLLWDDDLRPEGMNLVYDSGRLFGTFGFNFIDSDTRGPLGDRYGYRSMQLGYRLPLGNASELTFGASYFDFDTEGRPTLIPGLTFNNTTNPDGSLAYDYDELEFFAQWTTQVAGRPLIVFADLVENIEIDEQNKGYAFGFHYGGTDAPGDWELSSAYQVLEADAVYGAFTDSDFAGGGTDNRGYSVSFAYAVNASTEIKLTYFDTERAVFFSDEDLHFQRGFLDFVFRY